MAVINDLINKIDDLELRNRIQAEVDKLAKQKKFGLVFEDHVPECTALYDVPIRVGSKVAPVGGKVAPKNKKIQDVFVVTAIDNGRVKCRHTQTQEVVEFPIGALVSIAAFGEAIYPYLKPIDSICNAPGSDLWHTLIEADNYHALQLLEYLYAGKVDCIYIDPPYNTGAKDWKYNNDYVDASDAYRHSKWLSMMEKRLKLAKNLLSPAGAIFISIDDGEACHLKCLCDDIFGAEAFAAQIPWRKRTAKSDVPFGLSQDYESILCYGMADFKAGVTKERKYYETKDYPGRPWRYHDLTTQRTVIERPNSNFTIVNPETMDEYPVNPLRCWAITQDTFQQYYDEGRIIFPGDYDFLKISKPVLRYWKEDDVQKAGSDFGLASASTKLPDPVGMTLNGTKEITSIFHQKIFNFPKPIALIKYLLQIATIRNSNALILDFFAGSGTTLHAVNLLNAEDGGQRRCIMVTNNEVSNDEAKKLTKAGHQPGDDEWEKLGIAHYVTWPRTVCSIKGEDVNGKPLEGNYGCQVETYVEIDGEVKDPETGKKIRGKVYKKGKKAAYPELEKINMADGFKSNAVFFKLGFLDKTAVQLGRQFRELLPVLWMKTGCVGPCPVLDTEELPSMLLLPENHFAVLIDEDDFARFKEKVNGDDTIRQVFLVTDSVNGYKEMIRHLDIDQSYQLYRDYLDNFRINTGR